MNHPCLCLIAPISQHIMLPQSTVATALIFNWDGAHWDSGSGTCVGGLYGAHWDSGNGTCVGGLYGAHFERGSGTCPTEIAYFI